MRCPACGRTVADDLRLCNYCGEPLKKPAAKPAAPAQKSSGAKQPTKHSGSNVPFALLADPRRFLRILYHVFAFVGVVVVAFEVARMITFAINVLSLLTESQLDAAIYDSMLVLPPFLATLQSVFYYLILIFGILAMAVVALMITDVRDRSLAGGAGGLMLLVLIFEMCGLPAKMGVTAMTLMLFALIPLLVSCMMNEQTRASAIGFTAVCVLVPVFELAFPSMFNAFMAWAGGATSYAEFLPLFNPLFYLVSVAAHTLPTCFAFSYFSKFFHELSDTYRPQKKARKKKTA